MKRINKVILLMFFLLPSLCLKGQNNDFDKLVDAEKAYYRNFLNAQSTTTGSLYDVFYDRFEWNVDPAVNYIRGSVTTYFRSADPALTQVDLDLSDVMVIDSVVYQNSVIPSSQFSDVLSCYLPNALPLNAIDSVTIYYQGSPGASGFGSFITQTHGNNIPVLWTLSEPWGASDWWPCKNSLTDKIDSIDVIVTTPSAYRAASNGVLLSETTTGSYKTYHWKSRYPIATYLVAIAVTDYSFYSEYVPLGPTDSLEVLNYVFPENLALWQSTTGTVIPAIQLYNSLIIPYPFKEEKYGHAQFGWGGGMEHQTMSYVSNTNQPLLAHELAHQWFGDHITCGSWEDIWLNEGFATYFEGLTQQYLNPQNWYSWKLGKINSVTSLPDGSVKCTDTTDIGRIFSGRLSYNKGSYLLHMLRWQVGDTAFFQGLRNYLNDPQLAGGFAKTPQLKQHLENSSGQNLTTFFNQWYTGQGNPSYQVVWNQSGSTVNILINQTTSHPSVPFYIMPVPIRFKNAASDTIVVFNNTFNNQSFSVQLPFAVDSVIFDPDLWILSSNNTVNTGIFSPNNNNLVKIYPNPASSTISVVFKNSFPGEIRIENELGQVVMVKTIKERETQINVATLSQGVYFLKFETGDQVSVVKFTRAD